MKLIFEGKILKDILQEMEDVLAVIAERKIVKQPEVRIVAATSPSVAQPVEKPVQKPVDKPVEKPVEQKRVRTEKQLANDEKMRVAALERVAAKRAAKAQAQGYATTLRKDLDRDPIERPVQDAPEATPFAEPEVDPVEMIKLREKTLEELRASFANGHQQEVMELLSRFGNGAKSFRELPPEAFPDIRKAIDLGALE